MKSFYHVIDSLRNELLTYPFVKTVIEGEPNEVDIVKQSIYPIANIQVLSVRPKEGVIEFDISLINADIVNDSRVLTADIFKGNNDRQDVLNNQLIVVGRLEASLRHGVLRDLEFELLSDVSTNPFTDRFENILSGWETTFTIAIPNEMSVC
jgi:hypothetical protein